MPRECQLNFSALGCQSRSLQHLDSPFSEEELHSVIKDAPREKAPGPDGFISLFFSSCWPILKSDLTQAVNFFMSMNQQKLHLLNQAYVVLIPKTSCPQRISEFRPISLIHSFAKLVSKLLANRLAPELQHIISRSQTTFIKRRSIHDSFMYVQEVIKASHKKKITALFIKLDISKTFDTVSWPYLLSIMEFLGFEIKWRNWISALWCATSSSFLLNGKPGVRQGDPLSAMLFLMDMEPLHLLFKKAQDCGLLGQLSPACDVCRISLYADDATMFIRPAKTDLQTSDCILKIFAQASGLHVNLSKTHYFSIRCDNVDLDFLQAEREIWPLSPVFTWGYLLTSGNQLALPCSL
jgi:hypothetical protein